MSWAVKHRLASDGVPGWLVEHGNYDIQSFKMPITRYIAGYKFIRWPNVFILFLESPSIWLVAAHFRLSFMHQRPEMTSAIPRTTMIGTLLSSPE